MFYETVDYYSGSAYHVNEKLYVIQAINMLNFLLKNLS